MIEKQHENDLVTREIKRNNRRQKNCGRRYQKFNSHESHETNSRDVVDREYAQYVKIRGVSYKVIK